MGGDALVLGLNRTQDASVCLLSRHLVLEARTGLPVMLDISRKGRDQAVTETPAQAQAAIRSPHGPVMPPSLTLRLNGPASSASAEAP